MAKYDSIIEIETVLHYGSIKFYLATYKSLNFKMYPSGVTVIKGSIHKYFNNGHHNYDDFSKNKLKQAISSLVTELGINPDQTIVNNLEFGVNIKTEFYPNNFLNQLIRFKSKQFNVIQTKGRGNGRECHPSNQYSVKIYNKGLQYGLNENTLRIEKRITTMKALKFTRELYLSDLLNPELWEHCKKELLGILEELTVNDEIDQDKLSKAEKEKYFDVVDQSNWAKLNKSQRCRRRKNFTELIQLHGHDKYIQNIVPLVKSKLDELTQSFATF